MPIHGGRVVARALRREGVSYVFTLCGGHVMSIYDGCLDEGIAIIDVRHEQSAAHAADGWARVTGQPGVAIVTAGPGLTDAVTGVASAWRANIPMLIIGGQGPHALCDKGSLPPDHPYYFHRTRKDALRAADVILVFGTPLDFRLGYGRSSHLNPEAKL